MTAESVTPLHVLLATDDSESAGHAEAWVSRLRWPRPCVVDVLCVAGRGIAQLGWGMQTYREPVRRAVEGLHQGEMVAAQRIANEVGERLQGVGLTVRTWARQGDAADEILAHIELERPDLVLVGSRGRSGLAELLLGSVSHQVAASAEQPVLVARQPRTDSGRMPARLLVLVDGSPAAEVAIDWVVGQGWAIGVSVSVVGLLGVQAGVDGDEAEAVSGLQGLVRGDAAEYVERIAEPLREQAAGLTVELEMGHPLDGARQAAGRFGADLVVVARPPRRRGQDPFAEKVARHLPASVLIVPLA